MLTVNGPAPHFRQKADCAGHSGLHTSHPGDERAQKWTHLKANSAPFQNEELQHLLGITLTLEIVVGIMTKLWGSSTPPSHVGFSQESYASGRVWRMLLICSKEYIELTYYPVSDITQPIVRIENNDDQYVNGIMFGVDHVRPGTVYSWIQ
jgi:hypothetical protein